MASEAPSAAARRIAGIGAMRTPYLFDNIWKVDGSPSQANAPTSDVKAGRFALDRGAPVVAASKTERRAAKDPPGVGRRRPLLGSDARGATHDLSAHP